MIRDQAKTSGWAKTAGVLATKGATAKAAVKPRKGRHCRGPAELPARAGAAEAGHLAGREGGGDEARRGPFAGPVVAAAVILYRARIPRGLDDSKRLSTERRKAPFELQGARCGSPLPSELFPEARNKVVSSGLGR
ncbi:ribonuclease HII [Bradyrhizobium oligotrophicum S58]|uniref:Ribonuclease n=1 Tax=Bradyrhizobium oligotrophicum S58 TaxID=1245469 RepID=M4ZYH3_9BRAD|nr:ribonuclease HII [Bradyrhizobium oligotrophicum S58]